LLSNASQLQEEACKFIVSGYIVELQLHKINPTVEVSKEREETHQELMDFILSEGGIMHDSLSEEEKKAVPEPISPEDELEALEYLNEIHAERFVQQRKFEEWKKTPTNAQILEDLWPDITYIAFKNDKIVAKAADRDELLEQIQKQSLTTANCYTTRIKDWIHRPYTLHLPLQTS